MCGVSRGTVDRVLNNRGRVRPETEERIRSVALSMGYRAKESAAPSALPTQQSPKKIGVVINAMDHPYFAEILSGVIAGLESIAKNNISGIVKLSGSFDVDQQLLLLDDLMAQDVSALVITPANSPRIAQKLESFSKKGIPVVTVSSLLANFTPFAFIGPDHYKGGRIAANFAKLLLKPNSKICVVINSTNMLGGSLRMQGFHDVIDASGLDCAILDPIQSFDDDVIAFKSLSGLLSRHPDVDLLFLAAGGYNGCYQAIQDVRRIKPLHIIAFDEYEVNVANLRSGTVSALFSQKPVEQGKTAIRVLRDYLLHHSIPSSASFIVPTEILLAESLSK